MKNLMLSIASLFLLNACSTDLDLGANYEELMVVFGLLNPNDSNQVIRINKGYFSQEGNIISIMDNLDSIYFDTTNLEVTIDALEDDKLIESFNFKAKTHGQLGIESDNQNHILYQANMNVNSSYTYQLSILNQKSGKRVEANTEIVQSEIDLTSPRTSSLAAFRYDNVKTSQEIEWNAPENGELFDLYIRFYYNEYNRENINEYVIDFASRNRDSYGKLTVAPSMSQYQVGTTQHIDIQVGSNISISEISNKFSIDFENVKFYEGIAEQLEETNLYRLPLYVDFVFTYSGRDLTEYIRIASARDGIVESSIWQPYTNIENGAGIFSSRTQSFVRRDFYNFWSEVKQFWTLDVYVLDTIDGVIETLDYYQDTTWILAETVIADFNKADPSNNLSVEFNPKAGSYNPLRELMENDITKDLNFIRPF